MVSECIEITATFSVICCGLDSFKCFVVILLLLPYETFLDFYLSSFLNLY